MSSQAHSPRINESRCSEQQAAVSGIVRQSGSIAALALVLLFAIVPGSALAAGNHSFNALLSLTGGTGVSKTDPVPDPPPTHPPSPFRGTYGVAVDSHGDVYVPSYGQNSFGEEGRVDIFNAAGEYLTQFRDEVGPADVVVDSTGVVYLTEKGGTGAPAVVRYTPSSYPPTSSTTYGAPELLVRIGAIKGSAINPVNDHLLVVYGGGANEFGSAAEGNPLLRSGIGAGTIDSPFGVGVDAEGNIYVGAIHLGGNKIPTASEPFVSDVFVFSSSGDLIETIDGSETPAGGFQSDFGRLYPAFDPESHELIVSDVEGSGHVYRFNRPPGGPAVYQADSELETHSFVEEARVAVATGPSLSTAGVVYVASSNEPSAHIYAFSPQPDTSAPAVLGTMAAQVTDSEAIVSGEINPKNAATEYRFEYLADTAYRANVAMFGSGGGFRSAAATPTESLPTGNLRVPVSAALSGLESNTLYRFRLVAANHCDPAVPDRICETAGEHLGDENELEVLHRFATFPTGGAAGGCPNEAFRIGPSQDLADCRAYEMVSPAEGSQGHPVADSNLGATSQGFSTEVVAASGESVLFETFGGGSLAGLEGSGYLDRYVARREPTGWKSANVGPTGAQTEIPAPGGVSADHGYSFWSTGSSPEGPGTPDEGSLALNAIESDYLRGPAGEFKLLGEGSLHIEPRTKGRWISSGGDHVIFTSGNPLEPGAAAGESIYDRTKAGVTQVVSLLPGDQPVDGIVQYEGTSASGSAVAFTVELDGETKLYVRLDDSDTVEVTNGAGVTYAGLSSDGRWLFYVQSGDIYRYDLSGASVVGVGFGRESTVVNISADGSHVYFVSPKLLVGGPGPTRGEPNLYAWEADSEALTFIATVTAADVAGEKVPNHPTVNGLGQWVEAIGPDQSPELGPRNDPSRTTPNGRFFVFESRASLGGALTDGNRSIYRYDALSDVLVCVSCRAGGLSVGDAALQSLPSEPSTVPALNAYGLARNVSEDGSEVFFQTAVPLAERDANGVMDVYEWEAQGSGGCDEQSGCISLISDGSSSGMSALLGVSSSGRDVMFVTTSKLLPISESGGTAAIYDARVDGGFSLPTLPTSCDLDQCQVGSAAVPQLVPASASLRGPGNLHAHAKCPKPKRKHRVGHQRSGNWRSSKCKSAKGRHERHQRHARYGLTLGRSPRTSRHSATSRRIHK